jgi:hypothetical protein
VGSLQFLSFYCICRHNKGRSLTEPPSPTTPPALSNLPHPLCAIPASSCRVSLLLAPHGTVVQLSQRFKQSRVCRSQPSRHIPSRFQSLGQRRRSIDCGDSTLNEKKFLRTVSPNASDAARALVYLLIKCTVTVICISRLILT